MSQARGAFILSGYSEPFGGVQVECMLSGTPTITTDWGAFCENNVHGVTGYRCRTMAQILCAIRNIDRIDPHVCRQHASRFLLPAVAPLYETFFQMVLDVYRGDGWYAEHTDEELEAWSRPAVR